MLLNYPLIISYLIFFQIAKVASYLKRVRGEILPHLEKFSVEAMNNSAPVIRPLWMFDPHDPINQVKDDEFLIGDKVCTISFSFIESTQRLSSNF